MPKLTGLWESPDSAKVSVTVATDSATVLASAALASVEVSATTTNDSFSFEHPPAAPASRASNGRVTKRDRARRSVRRGRRPRRDARMGLQRIGAGAKGARPVFRFASGGITPAGK